MFAAFQKASKSTEEYLRASALNWVARSGASSNPELDVRQRNQMLGDASHSECVNSGTDSQWVDVPLSDEDEEPTSPGAILQLGQRDETESTTGSIIEAVAHRSDGAAPPTDPPVFTGRKRFNFSVSSSELSSPLFARNESKTSDLSLNWAKQKAIAASSCGDFCCNRYQSIACQESDDYVDMKAALQRRLDDALHALTLTRNQADKLRDRLRTCTSDMKEQTDYIRILSRNLSNVSDKATEYRLQCKIESNLKEEAKKRVGELVQNTKFLEKTLGQRDLQINIFHQGIDTLNILLGVDAHYANDAQEKLTCTTTKVNKLLELVEKLQTDAKSAMCIRELKESLNKFEEEKASWASFMKNNEAFTDRTNLDRDDDRLRAELKETKRSSSEIKAHLSRTKGEFAEKEAGREHSRQTIYDFQAALVVEKQKNQATQPVSSSNAAVQTPSPILRENKQSNKSLHQEIVDLQRSITNMSKNFANTEEECVRLRGDVRQLRRTCHHQQKTIQTVRTENRGLRISISNMKLGRKSSGNEHNTETAHAPKRRRYRSGLRSGRDRDRLQTILESYDENNSTFSSTSADRGKSSMASVPSSKSFNLPSPTSSISSHPGRIVENTSSANKSRPTSSNLSGVKSNVNTTSSRECSRSGPSPKVIGDQASLKFHCKSQSTPNSKSHVTRQQKKQNSEYSTKTDRRIEKRSKKPEDFFLSSNASAMMSSAFTRSQSSKPYCNSTFQNGRLLAIPMSEEEFAKLVGSLNYDNESTCDKNGTPMTAEDDSWYDDGYSSFAADIMDYDTSEDQLYSTLVLHRPASPSMDTVDIESTRSKPEGPCTISYRGETLDASNFGIAEMRQFTWNTGISHSADEMHEFIDFLAAKADELDKDPIRKNAHSLGKSKDWLDLKVLF